MPLTITDEQLRSLSMGEHEARIEIACRLFDAGKMSFGHASKLAGVSEDQMYDEIAKRGIPRYRYTEEHLEQDLRAIEKLRTLRRTES